MPNGYDAIVVGGGHNGLVTAAYLAKGGLRTLVLERRERVGGAADTSEIAPGLRVPTLADTVGRLKASVARDLDLRGHGLRLVAPDVRVFAPQADGRAIVLWRGAYSTADGLRARSARDAERYVEFDRLVRSLGRFMADLAATTPPDIASPGFGDAILGLRLGRSYRGLGTADARTVLRVLPMAVADFVREAFETDALAAAIAWRGVRHSFLGPWSAGSTALLLADSAGNDAGAAGQTVFARGGPGALADALATAAVAAGGEIRTSAEVVAIRSRDGRATGVALASGHEIDAHLVVSGVDPKRTLLELCDPVAIGPSLGWRVSNYRTPGVVAKVNLALSRLPRFPSAPEGREGMLKGRILLASGIDMVERAFDDAKYGRLSAEPVVEATVPSLVDPSLVEGGPPGAHVLSALVQYAPYALRAGSWDALRDSLADAVVRRFEAVAPGFGSLVIGRQVLTPVDLEREYGLTGGHSFHGEMALDQFFLWRPLLGHARYRMALEGLYLCGSGAHPGGGITGGPGQNAAREILADWKKKRPK
jgi:phytoene dehydrogenase-like protein